MANRTIKLLLEYDGTDFVGWQSQQNGRAVQDVVEKGLAEILQEEIRIVGAGRTDSGVHAKGQVASFRTETSLNCDRIARGLNGVLPSDVVVLAAQEAEPEFNARHSARSRRYQYVIKNAPTAIARRYCWSLGYGIEVDVLNRCAKEIDGPHDFASFCKSDSPVSHHRCTVLEAVWQRPDTTTLVFDITADRFLHGMVRALVGTMVEIGRGYRKFEDLAVILEAKDRRMAGMAAPPQGLFLIEVKY